MDAASAAERDFATRTALASRAIWEWVEELTEWNWPSEGGPAGFETPSGKRRKLSIQLTRPEGEENDAHMGVLTTQDVVRYETRLDQIRKALEGLAVEDIKTQVLTNHIWPLSRPTTPMSDSNMSRMSSSSSYNRMEDLTAVVTAIVVQTLPNLARLSRLMQIWSIRLRVLQQIPSLLMALDDAEKAIKLGWNTISPRPKTTDDKVDNDSEADGPFLTRENFNIMKLVLEKKVSNTGRSLDFMLDCLEGLPDTLPDEWLDRMEAVERDYSNWVAACERMIRENEWAKANKSRKTARSPSPPKRTKSIANRANRNSRLPVVDVHGEAPVTLPVPTVEKGVKEPSKQRRDNKPVLGVVSNVKNREGEKPRLPETPVSTREVQKDYVQHMEPAHSGHSVTNDEPASSPPQITISGNSDQSRQSLSEELDSDNHSTDQESNADQDEDDLELPPLTSRLRRDSEASQETTILHGASSQFDGMSSDMPEISASPRISQALVREAEYADISPVSPPSSPPLLPTDAASSSFIGESSSFIAPDSPLTAPIREEDETLSVDGSYLDDYDDTFSVSEYAGPISRRESMGDQQLRQQISEIIEGIPAKIKLSTEPPRINLNPPDLQLPRIRKRPSIEPFKRSTSNLSTRTATPSFTLSPAKNVRARHQRSQQEIKVYHLSRSTGEAPIKLFIRCVGENGERVMVRVGGGWADLSEYLKEYASHHGRRSAGADKAKVEVRDVPRVPSGTGSNMGSSPISRPASALDNSPSTPLAVRKTRRSIGAASGEAPRLQPKTPAVRRRATETAPSSEESTHSRPSSRVSWVEDDSSFLGLAGPTGKKVEMSAENKAWVESVKEKVRLASGERKLPAAEDRNRFGELGKVGGTKRLFPKAEDRRDMKR
jgi:hypothetical protein